MTEERNKVNDEKISEFYKKLSNDIHVLEETHRHIDTVGQFIDMIIKELTIRKCHHDESKMENKEFPIFVEYTPKLKKLTYGSDEYKKCLKEMEPALKHHYKKNAHHPEHFINGIDGMNLVDLIEMICDWKAATLRHNNGNMEKSLEINKERFKISDQLMSIMKNTCEDLGWK